jgi:hypothetical protein
MALAVEITIILKDEERTFKQKFLCYEALTLDPENRVLKEFIKQACDSFKGSPEDIVVKASMVVQ